MTPSNPWQTYLMLCGLSALVGGGCGAGAALAFAERRVGALELQLEGVERRVSRLEALRERVDRLEATARARTPRGA